MGRRAVKVPRKEFEPYARRVGLRVSGRSRVPRQPGEMNGTERRYAEHLDAEQEAGRVAMWMFEPMGLRLAKACTYNPDFLVVYPDGATEIHEVKGRWEDDALVKIKCAAEMFPLWRFVAVRWVRGMWEVREFESRTGE